MGGKVVSAFVKVCGRVKLDMNAAKDKVMAVKMEGKWACCKNR